MIQALHCIFELVNVAIVHYYNVEQNGLLLETVRKESKLKLRIMYFIYLLTIMISSLLMCLVGFCYIKSV